MAESIGVLLLPCRLEEFELADHARDLLAIPRIVALEPPRLGLRGIMREATAVRQARRLRLPGEVRLVVLYYPAQYPLARALCSRHASAELWYVRAEPPLPRLRAASESEELVGYDELARGRAAAIVPASLDADPQVEGQALRERLWALDIINSRPFVPGGRVKAR